MVKTKNTPRIAECFRVGLPRFELGMTGPESVVLPLHHSPIASAKVEYIFSFSKIFRKKIIFLFEIFCAGQLKFI